MLALAAMNVAAAVVFAGLYVAGGTAVLNQAAFLGGLVVFFVALTAVWVRVERANAGARLLPGRVVRIAAGLAMALFGFPALVLMPLFALRQQIPVEAGFDRVVPGMMAVTLASLILTAGVNLAGVAYLVVASLRRTRRRAADRPGGP